MPTPKKDDDVFITRAERAGKKPVNGSRKLKNGVTQTVFFDKKLHSAINKEALSRGWTFSRMVRFLCNASIDGIE